MFSKQELHTVIKTLTHRKEWLIKNLDSADQESNKTRNQETLALIESSLRKLISIEEKGEMPKEPQPSHSIKVSAAQRRQQLPAEKIRVLLVDDDNASAEIITLYLQALGIKIIDQANDGLKALSMLFNANPVYDLVICDWNMPFKNGLEVHTAMRTAERYEDVYFILATGITEARKIRAAIEEGVNDYLAKPIEQATLNKKMMRIFPQITLSGNPL